MAHLARALLLPVVAFLSGCATTSTIKARETAAKFEPAEAIPSTLTCNGSAQMKVHFFDVEQALAALVELPNGETILVDTGESRPGSEPAYEHLRAQLDSLLSTKKISMVWITHQHADHLGRIKEVLERYKVGVLVHNGTRATNDQVVNMKTAAEDAGTPVIVVDPSNTQVPLAVASPVTLSAIVPDEWSKCDTDPNDCSIGLRIDYCNSSVAFLGDAEEHEEHAFKNLKPVTVLQAPHHGSNTSSSDVLLTALAPKYVVISSGQRRQGYNENICHPIKSAVLRLSAATQGVTSKKLWAFRDDGGPLCRYSDKDTDKDWEELPVSDTVFSTARDGDVTMVTDGDGSFDVSVAK